MKSLIGILLALCFCFPSAAATFTIEEGQACQKLLDEFVKYIDDQNAEGRKQRPESTFLLTGKLLDCRSGPKALIRLSLDISAPAMDTNKKPAKICLFKTSILVIRYEPEAKFFHEVLAEEDPVVAPCDLIQDEKDKLLKSDNPKKPVPSKPTKPNTKGGKK